MTTMATPQSTITPLVVHGSTSSYFTGKLEAYLRYKEIPYEFVSISPDVMKTIRTNVGIFQVPTVRLADGRWMTDTTPMLRWLETEFPEPAIYPTDPVARFLSLFLEDYADEWLWRPAMHYRWSFPEDRFNRGTRLGAEIFRDRKRMPAPLQRKLIQQRQLGTFIRGDGVDPTTRQHADESYLRVLDLLEPIVQSRPYLLGERPSLVDIAFMGPMFRHFAQDPTPAHIMADRAPGVWEWVARMWNARASRFGDRELLDEVPRDWDPLFAESARTHLEQLDANARAHKLGEFEHDLVVEDVTYRAVPTSPYRVWCLEQLRARFDELDETAAGVVRRRLEAAGAWEPMWRTPDLDSGHDPDGNAPFCAGSRVIPTEYNLPGAVVRHRRWFRRG
jgi:glutathione S-transferase